MKENKFKKVIFKIFDDFASELYPENFSCCGCGREMDTTGENFLCEDCIKELFLVDYACKKCGEKIDRPNIVCDTCKNQKRHFDKNVSCFLYSGIAKHLVYKMKYGGEKFVSKVFANYLFKKYLESDMPKIDILTCVPLSAKRYKDRGFNQAEEIARHFAYYLRKNNIEVFENYKLLKRVKTTESQAHLSIEERKQNIEDAFVVDKEELKNIKGKNIFVIDDIMTTGATLDEIAKVLKKAIYRCKVFGLTVCRTENRQSTAINLDR